MELQDKTIVVTGASRGIGHAFARALIARGAFVFGIARNESSLRKAHEELGAQFYPLACDVTDPDAVARAFQTVTTVRERLDVLVNNAGLGRFSEIEQASLDDWSVQIETNLTGVFLCTREAVPVMKDQNAASGFGGHIVNVASIAGLVGNPSLSAYNASKFGLRGFSESLMKELRSDGIKVTCMYPGSVQTGFGDTPANPNSMFPDDIAASLLHVLETDENYLVSEIVMRPLRPKG
jgi:NAD(P)-dependent dehydrogenase (short-subunit alcohol dehydrogenase family)